jgi:hypothetical protein
MVIRNFPKEAKRVLLVLTKGKNEKGGQEVELPSSGEIPAGAATIMGPCNTGSYRWSAIFKAAGGQVVGEAYVEKDFPWVERAYFRRRGDSDRTVSKSACMHG